MKYDVIVSSIKNSNLTFQQAGQGICPAEGTDPATDTGTATVDPSYTGCDALFITRISPLQTCKNNCKGGENIQSRSDVLKIYFQYNSLWWVEEQLWWLLELWQPPTLLQRAQWWGAGLQWLLQEGAPWWPSHSVWVSIDLSLFTNSA